MDKKIDYFCIKKLEKGVVVKSTGSWYSVKTSAGLVVDCKIRGKFRTKGIKTTNPVAVGDNVEFKIDEKTDSGVITRILPRKNYIIRKSINLSKQAHILAANVDMAVLIVTLKNPKTYPEFIDRFLVSAEAYKIPATVIFNKIDIYSEEENNEMLYLTDIYTTIGYKCIHVSAMAGDGTEIVKELLKDRITVIAGHSGVGKSTLVNRVEPKLNLKTKEISDYHKQGKHTTTFAEMYSLSFGGYIIDTPGIKGFGIIDIKKEELFHFFPEIFRVSKECRFHNCTHSHEPGCAVKEAVASGVISEQRFKSYINMLFEDDDEKYRTNPY